MCSLKDGFKLCSCNNGDIDYSKPYWILKRAYSHGMQLNEWLIGESSIPYTTMMVDEDLLIRSLNSRNVFDFDYSPREGDKLYLYFPAEKYLIHYSNGSWFMENFGGGIPRFIINEGAIQISGENLPPA